MSWSHLNAQSITYEFLFAIWNTKVQRKFTENLPRTSLAVQWLSCLLPSLPLQQAWVQSQVRELRSHMLQNRAKEIKVRSESVSCSVISDSLWPHELQPTRLLCPWNSPDKKTGVGKPFPSPGDLPNPGIKPGCHVFQADSLLSKPPGKPSKKLKNKNKWVQLNPCGIKFYNFVILWMCMFTLGLRQQKYPQ